MCFDTAVALFHRYILLRNAPSSDTTVSMALGAQKKEGSGGEEEEGRLINLSAIHPRYAGLLKSLYKARHLVPFKKETKQECFGDRKLYLLGANG